MLIIPDIFSPYIKGRQAAVQDNWTDLLNTNRVTQGTLNNLFSAASMPTRLDTLRSQSRGAASQADILGSNARVATSTEDKRIQAMMQELDTRFARGELNADIYRWLKTPEGQALLRQRLGLISPNLLPYTNSPNSGTGATAADATPAMAPGTSGLTRPNSAVALPQTQRAQPNLVGPIPETPIPSTVQPSWSDRLLEALGPNLPSWLIPRAVEPQVGPPASAAPRTSRYGSDVIFPGTPERAAQEEQRRRLQEDEAYIKELQRLWQGQ